MKLQLTLALLCALAALAAARPGCHGRGGRYGKRSPGCHGNRNGGGDYGNGGGRGGSGNGGGRAATLAAGLRGQGLNTLLSLVQRADLVGALSGSSDLTVFAPTDAALARFIGSLPSAPDDATVKTVLLNHVISGKAKAADISNGLTVKNLAGNDMTFRTQSGLVTVGGARINLARTDLPLLSLTVHVLDDVINPANLPGR